MPLLKIFILSLLLTLPTSAQEEDNDIIIGSKHKIYSETLKEEREFWVQLPSNYDQAKQYDVIVMLDARFLFKPISGITKLYGQIQIAPQSILVRIPNTDRMRDLTPSNTIITSYKKEDVRLSNSGGSENFLKFISSELLPTINQQYSITNNRTFFGHSNGGLFASYLLVEKPELFNAYIIVDPTVYWDNELVLNNFKTKNSAAYKHIKGVYISSANNKGDEFLSDEVMYQTQKNFTQEIQNKNINFKFERFNDENHNTVPFISIRKGLEFIYK